MRASKFLVGTHKESSGETSASYNYLFKSGMIHQTSAGIYAFSPLGQRVLDHISRIVEEEMNYAGALKVSMPILQPSNLWKESERWDIYGEEMFKVKNREGREFCLGPTHEEVICDFARPLISSYRDLPITLYQIGTKFRDELRPRQGLVRGREFLMKDAYSFDTSEEGLKESYSKMKEAYKRIFQRTGLEVIFLKADTEEIGGTGSEEVLAPQKSAYDLERDLGGDGSNLAEEGIEVGHIFKLGTRYSEKMKVLFNDGDGVLKPCIMGCYGIGISRVVSAVIEQNHDQKGIIWPKSVSPFDLEIIPLGKSLGVREKSEEAYLNLVSQGRDVFIDDRNKSPGEKFNDADLIGVPARVIIGEKSLSSGNVEYEDRVQGSKQAVSFDSLYTFLNHVRDNRQRGEQH